MEAVVGVSLLQRQRPGHGGTKARGLSSVDRLAYSHDRLAYSPDPCHGWLDLSLPALIRAMVGSEEYWNGVITFCSDVFLQKVAAEREKVEDPNSLPIRRERHSRRRKAYLANLLPYRRARGQSIGGCIVCIAQSLRGK